MTHPTFTQTPLTDRVERGAQLLGGHAQRLPPLTPRQTASPENHPSKLFQSLEFSASVFLGVALRISRRSNTFNDIICRSIRGHGRGWPGPAVILG